MNGLLTSLFLCLCCVEFATGGSSLSAGEISGIVIGVVCCIGCCGLCRLAIKLVPEIEQCLGLRAQVDVTGDTMQAVNGVVPKESLPKECAQSTTSTAHNNTVQGRPSQPKPHFELWKDAPPSYDDAISVSKTVPRIKSDPSRNVHFKQPLVAEEAPPQYPASGTALPQCSTNSTDLPNRGPSKEGMPCTRAENVYVPSPYSDHSAH